MMFQSRNKTEKAELTSLLLIMEKSQDTFKEFPTYLSIFECVDVYYQLSKTMSMYPVRGTPKSMVKSKVSKNFRGIFLL